MKAFVLPIVWVVIITLLSFLPVSTEKGISIPIDGLDKVIHGIFYLVLTFLVVRSYKFYRGKQKIALKQTILLVFGVILYGIGIELAQEFFFLSRHFEMLDIIANIIGTISGYLLINYVTKDKL